MKDYEELKTKVGILYIFCMFLLLLSFLTICYISYQLHEQTQEEITKYDIPYKPENKTPQIYVKRNKELKPGIVNETSGEIIQEIQAEPFEIVEYEK